MRKYELIKILIFAAVFSAFLFFRNDILNFYSKIILGFPQIEKNLNNLAIEKIEKQVFTPPPLRAPKEELESFLTQKGIIAETNKQRVKYGLLPLQENIKLDNSAEMKVKDMFKNQYFAHQSPSGANISDLVKTVGYNFIAIGENLALGNFKDEQALVQAWMDSPGHRANILNPKYKEIGVAVERGLFEGKTTWLAVQHFGTPLSACKEPDLMLKMEIEANQIQIQALQQSINTLANEIKKTRFESRQEYEQKIEQYNNLVSQYNKLVGETKKRVNQYNFQVQEFNRCISS